MATIDDEGHCTLQEPVKIRTVSWQEHIQAGTHPFAKIAECVKKRVLEMHSKRDRSFHRRLLK